jgi:hypothetical protein
MEFDEMGFGKMVFRRNILSAKYPFGEISLWRNGFGEIGFGEMDFGEKSGYPFPSTVYIVLTLRKVISIGESHCCSLRL